jgi:hypothetical protein
LGIIPLSASDLAATTPAVALLFIAGRFRQPAVLGRPYEREG